ncbi:type VI secretion system protein ImpA [Arboricoccus pini]|uniref:Type VI secretion system protein ImpA n=1 Tax=Arboricoccus pini TaxID=1963835 RepID=A0A212RQR6_9PROT|nr:type VI secretion system protein TssA [Arboricoccus pini]SNB74759.1 type VI secretion system protein ImpA [Arboricoccus pini]
MIILDVAAFLAPISQQEPCGQALDYDLDFLDFDMAIRGKPAQHLGESLIPAEAPDWATVVKAGTALGRRTKDLRIVVALASAALVEGGFPGLREALAIIAGYVEVDWQELHPRPDPEDGDDETVRISALTNLCDPEGLIARLRQRPLAASERYGAHPFLAWQEAQRDILEGKEQAGPDLAILEQALRDSDPHLLKASHQALTESLQILARIDKAQRQHLGVAQAVDLNPLRMTIEQIGATLEPFIPGETAETPSSRIAEAPADIPSTSHGEIRGRDDVVLMLDRISTWYRLHEPASPVPTLLERAKRLVSKDFLSLLMEIAPDGAGQFRALAGMSAEQGQS